jgi:hypothetical protein
VALGLSVGNVVSALPVEFSCAKPARAAPPMFVNDPATRIFPSASSVIDEIAPLAFGLKPVSTAPLVSRAIRFLGVLPTVVNVPPKRI